MISLEIQRPLVQRARGERDETHGALTDERARGDAVERRAARGDAVETPRGRASRGAFERQTRAREGASRVASGRRMTRGTSRAWTSRAGAGGRARGAAGGMRARAGGTVLCVLVAFWASSGACANAGGAGTVAFDAVVIPPAVFASRETSVRVHGLNFLPGRDAACSDCNAGTNATTLCAFGGARDNGVKAVFENSDPSAFVCAVNGNSAAQGAPARGHATGSWSANGGYDWGTFGGERASSSDGTVHLMKMPTIDRVVASAAPMGMPTYVSGADFTRGTLGCYFESKDASGTWTMRATGTFEEASAHGGLFVSSVLYRCESPTFAGTTPATAQLARFTVGVLGDDGSALTNVVRYKENYWVTPGAAKVGSLGGYYSGAGGEIISVSVSDSDGDGASLGCLVGAIRVSARAASTAALSCIAPARVPSTYASVSILVGVRHAEQSVSSISSLSGDLEYTGRTPEPSDPYTIIGDDLFLFGRGGQIMNLSSTEDFTCTMTYVVDNVTSVFRSTTANPSPFADVVSCLLPLNVQVGFVALGITGGQYESIVQVMFVDPPRALSASPRRSPSEGAGLAWVYGTNLNAGTEPSLTCVFTADESRTAVTSVGDGARVSSALVACELPPASLVIVQNSQRSTAVALVMRDSAVANVNALDSGASIEYAVNVASASITPIRGSIDGGTPVRLDPSMSWVVSQGSTGTPDTDDFGTGGCRFGAITVAARVADSGAIECVTPSMGSNPASEVPVAIAVDWRTSSAPLVFFTSSNTFLNFSFVRF